MKGWIKDYRQEMDGDIWSMPPLYHRIWQYLKYMANHEENIIPMRDGSKLKIAPGQHLTSLRNIAQGVAWYERGVLKEPNVKTVSAVLDWLENEGMITIDTGNRKYTAITLVKWDIYQGDDDHKVTVDGYVSKQSLDTNKNDKNVKNDKKDIKTLSRNKKTYSEDSTEYKMALYLHSKIMKHAKESGVAHLVEKANLQKWADDCRKLLEIDKVEKVLIKEVIDWVTAHSFWKSNILSAAKLREQFQKLAITMSTEKKGVSHGRNEQGDNGNADGPKQQSLTEMFTKS